MPFHIPGAQSSSKLNLNILTINIKAVNNKERIDLKFRDVILMRLKR